MIIITKLKGSTTEGVVEERRGFLTALHLEPAKGFFMKMQLGEKGLFVRRGDQVVVIPTEELLALAAPHFPDLKPVKAA